SPSAVEPAARDGSLAVDRPVRPALLYGGGRHRLRQSGHRPGPGCAAVAGRRVAAGTGAAERADEWIAGAAPSSPAARCPAAAGDVAAGARRRTGSIRPAAMAGGRSADGPAGNTDPVVRRPGALAPAPRQPGPAAPAVAEPTADP